MLPRVTEGYRFLAWYSTGLPRVTEGDRFFNPNPNPNPIVAFNTILHT